MRCAQCMVAIATIKEPKKIIKQLLAVEFLFIGSQRQWRTKGVYLCERQDNINIKTAVICNKHFKQDDFNIIEIPTLTNSMRSLKRIIPNVLPSLCVYL